MHCGKSFTPPLGFTQAKNGHTTELYYISGDRALAKKVWQKTWRIFFPEELLRSLDSCCQPLTMAQVLVGTEFTPP